MFLPPFFIIFFFTFIFIPLDAFLCYMLEEEFFTDSTSDRNKEILSIW